jgi:acyl-CoA synthetase (AMP-forming)/AMP-acid ligase II
MQFNIADLFESLADAIPERTALVCGTTRLSFSELDARANRLASFLCTRGVGAGSHVGLHLYNGPEFVEGMLASFKLRAVPINVNYRYVAQELRYLCDNADLAAILSQRELADQLRPAIAGLSQLSTVVLVDDGAAMPQDLGSFDYEQVLAQGSAARDFGPRSGDDLYVIYTGGTTGMPKGVMWRHEDVFFAGLQGGRPGGTPIERPEELAVHARDADSAMTILPAAPFIHGAAQWGALIGLFTGGKVVLQGGRSFDARRVCELIAEENVSTITLVGDAMARPLVEALAAPGASYDTSSLFAIASAGAVLSPTIREQLRELLPNTLVLNNFGSTEAGHQGTALPGSESGTEGRPSFYMDPTNAVFDDDSKPIEPGSGKIGRLARGGRIPLGYYKDPQKTAERFVEVAGKRWCLPGDFATVEADGRITVFGRGNVCINTGGEKVFPEEVEEVLKAHPDVFDAVVVGVPDERWMQRVVAVVEPRAGRRPTLDELQAHCRASIAGYKVPRQLTVVERIERQPSGKPDYGWARDAALRDSAG